MQEYSRIDRGICITSFFNLTFNFYEVVNYTTTPEAERLNTLGMPTFNIE